MNRSMDKLHDDLRWKLLPKLVVTLRHWTLVDEYLPPDQPLVVLERTPLEAARQLVPELPRLHAEVRKRRQEVALAQAEARIRKRVLHDDVRWFNQWVRGYFPHTILPRVLVLLPGIGEGFDSWFDAAVRTLRNWQWLAAAPPPGPGWPMDRGDGFSQAQFEQEIKDWFAAHDAIREARLEVRLADGALAVAMAEAEAILKAYGHAARSRLRENSALRALIPRLWPKRTNA